MYSFKVEQAIQAATLLHQDQLRKGTVQLPYISHLMAVTLLLRDYTDDENTIIAALLHDTVEDTDYTIEEVIEDFGEKVATIITALTEPKEQNGKKLTWLETKKAYASQLRKGPEEAVLIAAADKTHNFRTMVEEYFDDHKRYAVDFGPHIEARIEAYQAISNAINSRLRDGIVHEFNNTFTEFKKFLFDVEKTITTY